MMAFATAPNYTGQRRTCRHKGLAEFESHCHEPKNFGDHYPEWVASHASRDGYCEAPMWRIRPRTRAGRGVGRPIILCLRPRLGLVGPSPMRYNL